jgi:hypothetical protein
VFCPLWPGAAALIVRLSHGTMQDKPTLTKTPLRLGVVFVGSAGMTLLLACALAFLACSIGSLFGGIDAFFTVVFTSILCPCVVLLTALALKLNAKRLGWAVLFIETMGLALLGVALFSWFGTRQHMEIILNPASVPPDLHVHRGTKTLFSSFVHFSGPPEVIARLLHSKGLLEVPSAPDEAVPHDPHNVIDLGGLFLKDYTGRAWGWWRPATMSNPRFFYRHHESMAPQGWSEGWWVSGATNEVYAHIGG